MASTMICQSKLSIWLVALNRFHRRLISWPRTWLNLVYCDIFSFLHTNMAYSIIWPAV